jgi:hypothetical protein
MGLDNPSGGKQSLPGFQTNVKTSGGDQAYISGPGFHFREDRNIGNDIIAFSQSLGQVAAKLKQQKEEAENRQRSVDMVRLQTETQLDLAQAYEQYKNSYNGPDAEFTTGWMEQSKKYVDTKRASISDERLLQSYDKFQMPYMANSQLQAMQDENLRYTNTFRTNLQTTKQNLDDLLAQNPTPGTLRFVIDSLDTVYSPIQDRLRAAGKENEAKTELAGEKEKYTIAMVKYMAKKDPDAALAALQESDVNQHIADPDTRLEVESYIERIKNHQVDGLRQEFVPVLKSYQEALALGKDPAPLLGKLQMYAGISGVVRPEEMRQIDIAQQMAGPYASVRSASVNMSDAEFEDALAQLRDQASGTVDEDLPFRMDFHEKAVSALRNDRISQKRNPISTVGELTGAADAPTARMQYIAARLSAGENIDRISIMDQAEAERLTNAMHNAVAGNRIGDIVTVWQQMRDSLGSESLPADQPIQGDVSMMDMALAQLARTTKDPLSKNVIAALSLLPSGQEPSADNVLLKAAFITPPQETGLLQQAGVESMNKLGIKVAQTVPEWNLYFRPTAGRSVRGGELLAAQQSLMLRTVLLNMATGQYGPTGGFAGIGQTSAQDNAIQQTIKGFLPFSAVSIDSYSPRENSQLRFKPSKLLVPDKYSSTVTPGKIKGFLGTIMGKDSFWQERVALTGTQPATLTAVNDKQVPKQISQWMPTIQEAAQRYNVPAWLVAAVMYHESGGNAKAVGGAQDSGLMQIIPSTFAGLRRQDPSIGPDVMDPKTNIMAGAKYLGDLYRVYKGDLTKILRNYNGGPGAVYKPNTKVQSYVPKVMANIEKFRPTEAPKPTAQNRALMDYAKRHIMDAISLENTDDFSGVRVMVDYQGRRVPLPGRDGRPFEIRFDNISNYVSPQRDPQSLPSSFLFR